MEHLTTAAIMEALTMPARPATISMNDFLTSIEKRVFRMAEITLQRSERLYSWASYSEALPINTGTEKYVRS